MIQKCAQDMRNYIHYLKIIVRSRKKNWRKFINLLLTLMKKPLLKPVSYTHLDVYKRQALYITGTKKMENNDLNGAYNDANAAIALSPNFGEYYNLRGRATLGYLKAGKEVPVGNADIDKDLFKGQDLDGYKMQPRRDLSEFYAAIANGTYDNKYVARYDRGSFGSCLLYTSRCV